MIGLVLLGPPGCGKGTQAEKLSAEYGLIRISTGDMLREEVNSGSELGRKVRTVMEEGCLVSDSTVLGLVGRKLREAGAGYVLDGFPRTVSQAGMLDRMLEEGDDGLDLVVAIELEDEVIIARLAGRRVCPSCGAVYNLVSAPPRSEGVCDSCGTKLLQRDDDREETIKERLRVYRERTEPLKTYYGEKSILREVNGKGSVEEVYGRVKATIAGLA